MDKTLSGRGGRAMAAVILTLAWPTMLEQLMQTAVQYIDTAMVGSLGTEATAAVGATTTLNWLIFGTLSAFGIGFLSFIARAYGANDGQSAKRATAQASLLVLILGIGTTAIILSISKYIPVWMRVEEHIRPMAAAYFFVLYTPMLPRTANIIFGTILRAAGDTKTPMKIGILMNFINIILNFLLIYPTRPVSLPGLEFVMPGAGLGVVGAALASAVAYTTGGILITLAVWKHPLLSPKGMSLRPDMSILRPCFKVSLPNMLQRFGTFMGYVVFAAMINSLGEVSAAAHTIANTVESLFYIPGYGMQTAAATLAGNAYGAGDQKRMKETASMFIPIELGLMALSGALLFFTAEPLVGLFSRSEEVIRLGVIVLQMVAISEPFFGFSIIVEGMMMGVGKTKAPFISNIIGMWLVRIVGTFLCTQLWGMGLVSAWACMIAHNIFLFILYLYCYIKGSWNPLQHS